MPLPINLPQPSSPASFPSALRAGCVVFILLFASYLRTAAPGVTVIDSGELALAARCLSNPHSPGYPGFSQAAHAVLLLLPLGSDSYRLAVFSGLGGATVGLLTTLLVAGLTGSLWPGVAAALLFGWSTTFWQQCCMVEVYPLALCFGAAMTLLVLWPQLCFAAVSTGRSLYRRVALAAFLLGIGVGFHHFNLFFVPGLGLAALWLEGRSLLRPRVLAIAATAWLLGFGSHVALPVRAATGPYYAWENPQSWTQFHRVVTTKNFHGQRWVRDWQMAQGYLRNFRQALLSQFPPPLLAVMAVGAALTAAWRPEVLLALLPLWCITSLMGTFYFNLPPSFYDTLRVFYLPGHWVLCIFGGMALGYGWRRVAAPTWLLVMVCLGAPLWTLAVNARESDRSAEWYVHDWGRALLLNAPQGGSLVFQSDEGFVLWFLQGSYALRPDVALLYVDLLRVPEIDSTAASWFWEQSSRNWPDKRLPTDGPPDLRLHLLLEQGPVITTFREPRYLPPGTQFLPRYPGYQVAGLVEGFAGEGYLAATEALPLRNPPAALKHRMTADRDYLEAYLMSLAETQFSPPSPARERLRELLHSYDPNYLTRYERMTGRQAPN